jgi:hypothetical protein
MPIRLTNSQKVRLENAAIAALEEYREIGTKDKNHYAYREYLAYKACLDGDAKEAYSHAVRLGWANIGSNTNEVLRRILNPAKEY